MLKYIVVVMCFLLLGGDCVRSSDDDALLERVRLAHRAARQSIQQFNCTYHMAKTLPNKLILAGGKYARSGERVSIRDGNQGISTRDTVISDGKCRSVSRVWKEGRVEYLATIESATQFFS
jgi:hypothetical protein